MKIVSDRITSNKSYRRRPHGRRFLFTLLEVIPHDLRLSRRLHRLFHQRQRYPGSAITQAKIGQAAIGTAQIEDGTITSAKIGSGEIQTANIHDGSITHAKIGQAAVESANIKDAAVDTAQIKDAAITNAKVGGLAVGTANIQDAAIVAAKILDGEIVTAKIAQLAVTEGKIADLAVTTAKIAQAAITNPDKQDSFACCFHHDIGCNTILVKIFHLSNSLIPQGFVQFPCLWIKVIHSEKVFC